MTQNIVSGARNPVVMGILNINLPLEQIIAQGEQMLNEGAAILDLAGGGESTRPNAPKISVEQEIATVIPIVQALTKHLSIPISIATSNAEVMKLAVEAGAAIINDVRSLSKPGALNMAISLGVPVCLTHIHNDRSMAQADPSYKDVVSEVFAFLKKRVTQCVEAGLSPKNIIVDPGFGFGKNLQHNLSLLSALHMFKTLNYPMLVGFSNKSMIGQILDAPADQRIYGSLAAAVIAIRKGADIIRTQDVKATVDAIKVIKAVG